MESCKDADIADLRRDFGAQADQVLAEHGLIVDEDSRDRLLVAIREAERLGAALLAKRAEGDYSPDPNAARFPVLAESSADSRLTRIVEAWKAEAAAVGTAESTITKYERILLRFVAFLGRDDGRAVTTEDVIRFKDHRKDREVPLHPQIVRLGFLEFVAAAPDGYLFSTTCQTQRRSEPNTARSRTALAISPAVFSGRPGFRPTTACAMPS